VLEARRGRLAAELQKELSRLVAREVKDPRIPSVTFTAVEVTQDGKQATIFVAILGGARGGHDGAPPLSDQGAQKRMEDCLKGLTSAGGFLRKKLTQLLNIQHVPQLLFREDKGFENANRVQELLKKISVPEK